jgi:hypothetical protein
MRKLFASTTLAALAVALLASTAHAAVDKNCGDYTSKAAAQAALNADPSDPNGLDALPGRADGNDDRTNGGHGDGQACESYPYPDSSSTVTGGGTTKAGSLPLTGPSPYAPVGFGLLIVGAALLLATRKAHRG